MTPEQKKSARAEREKRGKQRARLEAKARRERGRRTRLKSSALATTEKGKSKRTMQRTKEAVAQYPQQERDGESSRVSGSDSDVNQTDAHDEEAKLQRALIGTTQYGPIERSESERHAKMKGGDGGTHEVETGTGEAWGGA